MAENEKANKPHGWVAALPPFVKLGLLQLLQDGIMFRPKLKGMKEPNILAGGSALGSMARYDLKTSDKVNIVIEYEGPLSESQPLFIMFHGNTGHWNDVGAPYEDDARPYERDYRTGLIKAAIENGAGVVAVSLRGYGLSSGKPSEKGFIKDIEAVLDFVKNRARVRADRIIVLGESLGAASAFIAAELLTKRNQPPALLVTVSAFTSMARRAHEEYPDVPEEKIAPRLRHTFDNLARIDSLSKQTHCYFAHGAEDDVTKPYHTKELVEKAQARGLDVVHKEYKGAGHLDWPADKLVKESLDLFYAHRPEAEKEEV